MKDFDVRNALKMAFMKGAQFATENTTYTPVDKWTSKIKSPKFEDISKAAEEYLKGYDI